MSDPLTTNIQLAVPVRGSNVGTWDIPVNGDFTILDACFGAVTSVSLSSTTVNLSITQAQANIISFTGALTANVQVNFPAIYKSWTIVNNTTGNFFVQLVQGGSGIGAPPGTATDIFSDGTTLRYRNLPPVGSYWDYAGATVPLWVSACSIPPFLKVDGTTFSSATYPALFAILGTTTLPDSRARSRIPLDEGTSRVTTAGSGIDGSTRYASGGAQNVIIAQNKLPNTTLGVTGNVTISNPSSYQAAPGSAPLSTINGGPDGFVYDRFNQTAISLTATFSGGVTASLNGGVTQQAQVVMPPTYIGGITMIRAA